MSQYTVEVPREALEMVIEEVPSILLNDEQKDAFKKIQIELWEPYEPCPVCGSQEDLGESLVMSSPVAVHEDGTPQFTDQHFGESLTIECHNCDTVLLEQDYVDGSIE